MEGASRVRFGRSIERVIGVNRLIDRIHRDELAATLAAIEADRRGRSGSIQKPPRSLQAEMECEESGSSLGEQEDLRAEVARAVKRLKELCVHLRRGEDDSGLQSDCDESMLVIVNNTAETEEVNPNGQETLPSSVRVSRNPLLLFRHFRFPAVHGRPGTSVERLRKLDPMVDNESIANTGLSRLFLAFIATLRRVRICAACLHG